MVLSFCVSRYLTDDKFVLGSRPALRTKLKSCQEFDQNHRTQDDREGKQYVVVDLALGAVSEVDFALVECIGHAIQAVLESGTVSPLRGHILTGVVLKDLLNFRWEELVGSVAVHDT